MPGPKTPWRTIGKQCQVMGFIMPVGKSIVGSFSILSHADVVKLVVSMDKAIMPSLDPLTQIIERNLDEVLGGAEWRKYGTERRLRKQNDDAQ